MDNVRFAEMRICSLRSDIRYNPRTGEFEGLVGNSRRATRNSNGRSANGQRQGHSRFISELLTWLCVGGVIALCWNSSCGKRKSHKQKITPICQQTVPAKRSQSTRSGSTSVRPVPRPVCRLCGGAGQVCANCLGHGYYVLQCERCGGSGEKDSGRQLGETIGNVIMLPLAIVGNVLGLNEKITIEADSKCPTCDGTGRIRYNCHHTNGFRKCPECSR